MSYKSWLADKTEAAKNQLIEAKAAIKLAEFSNRLYDALYKISENDRFSYQIATTFEFTRILNSGEFLPEEKEQILPFIDEYKKIVK